MRVALLALVLTACGSHTIAVADATALAASALDVAMEATFRADVSECAPLDPPKRDVCIDGVVRRYEPAMAALEAFTVAHDRWVDAAEDGRAPPVDDLITDYCDLRGPLDAVGVRMPDDGGMLCR